MTVSQGIRVVLAESDWIGLQTEANFPRKSIVIDYRSDNYLSISILCILMTGVA